MNLFNEFQLTLREYFAEHSRIILVVMSLLIAILVHLPFQQTFSWDNLAVIGLYTYQIMLTFIILILVANILVRMANKPLSKLAGWSVFSIAFLYLLYWIPLGFDVTDEGSRMTHSWFMFKGLWERYINFKFGSHFINGLWLHILDTPLLIWGRIGYSLVKALTICFAYLILRRYFKDVFLFVAVIVALLVSCIYGAQVINYNNLPVFIVLIAIYCLSIGMTEPVNNTKGKLCFIISGFTLVLSVATRFPFVTLLVMPLIYFFLHYFIVDKDRSSLIQRLKLTYLGILCGLALVGLVLYSTDSLGSYINRVYDVLIRRFLFAQDEALILSQHDKVYITNLYMEELWKLLYLAGVYISVFIVTVLLSFRSGKVLRWLIYILYLVFLFYFVSLHIDRCYGIISINFALIILYLILGNGIKKYLFILFWPTILLLFSFVGSANGVRNMISSGGIVLSFAASLVLIRNLNLQYKSFQFKFHWIALLVILPVSFHSIKFKKEHIYRDMNKKYLNTMFQSKQLFGIFSNSKRVAVVDSLLYQADKLIIPNKHSVMCVNMLPMMVYLTNPSSYKGWKFIDPEQKRKELMQNDAPDFIIISHKNTRDRYWPNTCLYIN